MKNLSPESTSSQSFKNFLNESPFLFIGLVLRLVWPKNSSSSGKKTKCRLSTLDKHLTSWQENIAAWWSSLLRMLRLDFQTVSAPTGFPLTRTTSDEEWLAYSVSSSDSWLVASHLTSWTDQVLQTVNLAKASKLRQSRLVCWSHTLLYSTWNVLSPILRI